MQTNLLREAFFPEKNFVEGFARFRSALYLKKKLSVRFISDVWCDLKWNIYAASTFTSLTKKNIFFSRFEDQVKSEIERRMEWIEKERERDGKGDRER